MAINVHHPEYLKFIQHEIKTLNFLATDATINSNFPDLSSNASIGHQKYNYLKPKNLQKVTFEFFAHINLKIEKKNCTVVIEALLSPNYSMSTYSFSIIDSEKKELLRKFHFDYAPNEVLSLIKKPLYHIQYCGEASTSFNQLKIDIEPMKPWLSSPRLYHNHPINLALLVDMIFNEFRSDITMKIVEKKEWREFILNNESFLMKSYYENIARFFQNDHKYVKLFRDYCYGA